MTWERVTIGANIAGIASVTIAPFAGKGVGGPLIIFGVGLILLSVILYCAFQG